jgi:hypothetical protein
VRPLLVRSSTLGSAEISGDVFGEVSEALSPGVGWLIEESGTLI